MNAEPSKDRVRFCMDAKVGRLVSSNSTRYTKCY